MKKDTFTIELLPDGILKVVTDPISAPNHARADAFIKDMERLAGGETRVSKRADAKHSHHHVRGAEEQKA